MSTKPKATPQQSSMLARRIYRPEVCEILGWGTTWLARQIELGKFPPGRHDPGARRIFWLETEVAAALDRLNAAALREKGPAFPTSARRSA